MTRDDDFQLFSDAVEELLAALGQHFGGERAALVVRAWWKALQDLELDDLRRAMLQASKTCRDLPAPVDLRNLCQDYEDERRRQASPPAEPEGVPMPPEVRAKIDALFRKLVLP